MNEPLNLILPSLINNLEGSGRDEFTDGMPWILKKCVVLIIWKSNWKRMKQFLSAQMIQHLSLLFLDRPKKIKHIYGIYISSIQVKHYI